MKGLGITSLWCMISSVQTQPMNTTKLYSVQVFDRSSFQWVDYEGFCKTYDQQQAIKKCQQLIEAWEHNCYRVHKTQAN